MKRRVLIGGSSLLGFFSVAAWISMSSGVKFGDVHFGAMQAAAFFIWFAMVVPAIAVYGGR